MKIDCLDHPKTIDLATRLGICLPQAIGHLELLWAFVAQKTPQGDVGKWSNAVISHAAQWTQDPDLFVQAMTESGFFDDDDAHRLLIHDWSEHMPNWVRAKLKTQGKGVLRAGLSKPLRADYKGREGKGSQENGSQGKSKPSVESAGGPDRDVVNRIFEYWQETHNHPKAKLDDKRRKKIKARLADGYSEDDLLSAIRGCKKSPHHMGENDTGTVYDDLELICRDGTHVDKFIRLDGGPDTTRMSGSARKTSTAAQRWLEESHAEQ